LRDCRGRRAVSRNNCGGRPSASDKRQHDKTQGRHRSQCRSTRSTFQGQPLAEETELSERARRLSPAPKRKRRHCSGSHFAECPPNTTLNEHPESPKPRVRAGPTAPTMAGDMAFAISASPKLHYGAAGEHPHCRRTFVLGRSPSNFCAAPQTVSFKGSATRITSRPQPLFPLTSA